MIYTYKGESTIIPSVTGDFCPACDESILDVAESRRTMNLMLEFNKQVNASIVDPGFTGLVEVKRVQHPNYDFNTLNELAQLKHMLHLV